MSFKITRDHLNYNKFLSNLAKVFVDLHGNLSCAGWILLVLNLDDVKLATQMCKIFGCFKGEQSTVLMLAGLLRGSRHTPCQAKGMFGCCSLQLWHLPEHQVPSCQSLISTSSVWTRFSTGFLGCCSWWCRSMSRTSKRPLDTLYGVVLRLIWVSWPSSVILQIFDL